MASELLYRNGNEKEKEKENNIGHGLLEYNLR